MGSSQAQVGDDLVGRIFNGRFRIIELIARGGMGRVYRAEQMQLGRIVAVKTLNRRHDGDADSERVFQERFLNEASVTAKLQHPNTVRVFDYGRTPDGICFIVMELVEGRSLLAAIQAGAPFTPARTTHIALQIARSLREAHRLQVIHRDLKPSNVLLVQHNDQHDFVKVLDFGLVEQVEVDEREALTREGLFLGSPKYMAPEQILSEPIDARADVYSLGVCMYEMLTGRVPFEREGTVKTLMAHVNDPVPPLLSANIPEKLVNVVMRCLAKSPEARLSSMDEVTGALSSLASPSLMPSGEFATDAMAPQPVSLLVSQQQPLLDTDFGSQDMLAGTPSRAPSRRMIAMILSAIALAAVVVAVVVALLPSKQSTLAPVAAVVDTKRTPNVAAAAVARAATADVAESPSSPHMFLLLTSEPAGAFVTVYGRQYGPTPAHVEIHNPLIAQGSDISAVFQKSGFEPVSVTRVIEGGELRLHGMLPRNGTPRAHSSAQPTQEAQTMAATAAAPLPVVAKPQPTQVALATPATTSNVATAPGQPAAAPTKLAAQSPPKRAAPVITPSTLLRDHLRSPDYPRSARRAGIEGTVVVRVYVTPTGSVSGVDIVSGPEVFHEDVRSTLMTWKYTPAKLPDGKTTADSHLVQVPFKLQ